MKGKNEGSNKLLFSIKNKCSKKKKKQVFFGGAFTYSHTKRKIVFSKSYKKAPGHHPTKEEVPNIVKALCFWSILMLMEAGLLRKQAIYKYL